jgi:surface polysaccharide O-acyltransferase-like enzyme
MDNDLMREHSRIAGLDAARSSMMILGVLLHSLIFSIYFAHIESLVEAQTIFGVFLQFTHFVCQPFSF